MKRRDFIGAGLLLSAGSIIGCSRTSAKTVRVGYLPISESLPLFVAMESGYFLNEELEVQATSLDGGAKIAAAIIGQSLDCGISNYVSLLLARDNKLPIGLISGSTVETRLNPQHGLLVSAKSQILPKDLVGAKIAVNTRRNVNELFMSAYLESVGVSPTSVSLQEIPFPRMIAALESGAVSAAGCIEPFVTFGNRAALTKRLADFVVEIEDNVPITGWIAGELFVQSKIEAALGFRRAIQRALGDLQQNPERFRALLLKFTSISASDLPHVPLPTFIAETPPAGLSSLISRVDRTGWLQNAPLVPSEYGFVL